MKKIKQWLYNHFLPMWAKESVLAENRNLQAEILELRQRLEQQKAYIAGLEVSIKAQRRIIINTGEAKK